MIRERTAASFRQKYRSGCADLDTLGFPAAQVAMIGVLTKGRQGMEGTSFGPGCGPGEFLLLQCLIRAFSSEALHLFALTTEGRGVETGVQIILVDTDGRLLRVDDPEVKKGADHFTEVAAAASFFFNPDFRK